jgi:hypothetical protein
VAQRVEQAVAAKVQVLDAAPEDNLSIDFQPDGASVGDFHQRHHGVATLQEHFLEDIKGQNRMTIFRAVESDYRRICFIRPPLKHLLLDLIKPVFPYNIE